MLGCRLAQLIMVLGLANGCGSDANRAPGGHLMDTPGPTVGAAGVTAAGSGTAGASTTGSSATSSAAGGASEAGASGGSGGSAGTSSGDAGHEATATFDSGLADQKVSLFDDSSDPLVDDAALFRPCFDNRATLGSANLRAGGATPAAFAAAYNADLATLAGPGPLLIVLAGVNDNTPASWIASFGALDASGGNAGARFAGRHAEVGFTLGVAQSVVIPQTDATFELKFAPPASDALIPVVAIEFSGALASGCGSLDVSKARLLVPASAAAVTFHSSTIGALMGPPTETYRGQAAGAWPLELHGQANQTYAPAPQSDAGGAR